MDGESRDGRVIVGIVPTVGGDRLSRDLFEAITGSPLAELSALALQHIDEIVLSMKLCSKLVRQKRFDLAVLDSVTTM